MVKFKDILVIQKYLCILKIILNSMVNRINFTNKELCYFNSEVSTKLFRLLYLTYIQIIY